MKNNVWQTQFEKVLNKYVEESHFQVNPNITDIHSLLDNYFFTQSKHQMLLKKKNKI